MNDDQEATEFNAVPHDPAMFAPDPAMFAQITGNENQILSAHLASGWIKQGAVYPGLSEPWQETCALLDDLHAAWWAGRSARHGQPEAPEAGS